MIVFACSCRLLLPLLFNLSYGRQPDTTSPWHVNTPAGEPCRARQGGRWCADPPASLPPCSPSPSWRPARRAPGRAAPSPSRPLPTSQTTKPAAADGSCNPSDPGTSVTNTYDAADRITDAGFTYDAFGRITTVPAAAIGSSTATTATYYVTDTVHSLTQGSATRTWTLDPNWRLRVRTDAGATGTRINHYDGDDDNPAWVAETADASHWTRNIAGIDGDVAALQDSASGTTLQLANLHGDIIATASPDPAAAGPLATSDATEFGIPRTTPSSRYGWHGAKQREADDLTGVVLMGVRLYVPALGRFLQVDPVDGGSANDYDYANQDPVNQVDLEGTVGEFWDHGEWSVVYTCCYSGTAWHLGYPLAGDCLCVWVEWKYTVHSQLLRRWYVHYFYHRDYSADRSYYIRRYYKSEGYEYMAQKVRKIWHRLLYGVPGLPFNWHGPKWVFKRWTQSETPFYLHYRTVRAE